MQYLSACFVLNSKSCACYSLLCVATVKAVRERWWLLLDEINLAPAEVPLFCLLYFASRISC